MVLDRVTLVLVRPSYPRLLADSEGKNCDVLVDEGAEAQGFVN